MMIMPLCTIGPEGWNAFVGRMDAAAFRFINSGLAHPVLDWVMIAATMLGVGIVQSGMSLAFVLTGWIWDRVSLRRVGYAGLIAFALSGIAVQVAKFIWDRPRPLLQMFDVRIVGKPLFTHSFPSGHTMTAFAVCVACSVMLPKWRYVLIPLAFMTGLSRIYLGVHFPLDVIYGGLVGALIGMWSARIVGRNTNAT